jgi:hypothetical protein
MNHTLTFRERISWNGTEKLYFLYILWLINHFPFAALVLLFAFWFLAFFCALAGTLFLKCGATSLLCGAAFCALGRRRGLSLGQKAGRRLAEIDLLPPGAGLLGSAARGIRGLLVHLQWLCRGVCGGAGVVAGGVELLDVVWGLEVPRLTFLLPEPDSLAEGELPAVLLHAEGLCGKDLGPDATAEALDLGPIQVLEDGVPHGERGARLRAGVRSAAGRVFVSPLVFGV